jgi:hypothetical protein
VVPKGQSTLKIQPSVQVLLIQTDPRSHSSPVKQKSPSGDDVGDSVGSKGDATGDSVSVGKGVTHIALGQVEVAAFKNATNSMPLNTKRAKVTTDPINTIKIAAVN